MFGIIMPAFPAPHAFSPRSPPNHSQWLISLSLAFRPYGLFSGEWTCGRRATHPATASLPFSDFNQVQDWRIREG